MTAGPETLPGLVSTVLPVLDRPRLVLEAAESVLGQTWRPVELVVVDDGSTDDTPQALAALSARHPDLVRVLRQENAGPAAARETGRRAARGEFLQYLDSDDLLEPDKFERQVAALRARPECGLVYSPTREHRLGESPAGPPTRRTGEALETLFPHLLSGRLWRTVTPLLRRTLSDRVGSWAVELRLQEDLEYDARIGALGTRLAWCDGFLARHRHHGGARAGRTDWRDARAVGWWATALERVYACARRAGVEAGDPHMARFARSLFLAARRCGGVGREEQARRLLELAREASGEEPWDLRLFAAAARLVGWRFAGRLGSVADTWRARRRGGLRR